MALFKILKGQASNLGKESIRNGYCYVTLDNHKMYIDHVDTDNDGKEILNSGTRFCLNAEVADRLSTARIITLSGDASGSVSFDGSQDVTLTVDISAITVDLDNTNIGTPHSINADSLGGRPATDYATENYVLEKIAEAQLNDDLSGYATKEDLNNFITEIQSEYVTDSELTSYAKKSEIPDTSAFLTAEQVSLLINEALGVIENGSY